MKRFAQVTLVAALADALDLESSLEAELEALV